MILYSYENKKYRLKQGFTAYEECKEKMQSFYHLYIQTADAL